MNVLSTMSVDLGASTNVPLPSSLSIKYPESCIQAFKEVMENATDYCVETNINHLRKLVSNFKNISTYKPYRAPTGLLEKKETLMPVTVFNICGFPGNDIYGVSDVSVLVLCSKFLN